MLHKRRGLIGVAVVGVLLVGAFLTWPSVAGLVREARYWGPLPAPDVVGSWQDSTGLNMPDGEMGGGEPTIVTQRFPEPGCLPKSSTFE